LAARAIHERLQSDPCQSLVHGDLKEANIMFVSNQESRSEHVVMCDFQYCGQGTPAQDLAYFFCSSIDDLEDRQDEYLEYYVNQLTTYLPSHTTPMPNLTDMKDSLEWAYCDFLRFMLGWGSWGNDLTDVVRSKLLTLDGGKNLGSEEAYCAAMQSLL
jgi:thiamine kinase-like enzyme